MARAVAVTHYALHLRVRSIPRDEDKPPFARGALHEAVNLCHKRAGGIHHARAAALRLLQHGAGHAVRADDEHAALRLPRLLCNAHAAGREIRERLRIMNDGAERPHALPFAKQTVHRLHGAVHAEAEAGRLCNRDLQWPSSSNPLISALSRAEAYRRAARPVCPPSSSSAGMGVPNRTVTLLRHRSGSPLQ